jgi:hypothetical protein
MVSDAKVRALATQIDTLKRQMDVLMHSTQLGNSSVEDAPLNFKDDAGLLRHRVGKQDDGTFTATDHNGPPPPIPAKAEVSEGPMSLSVRYGGKFAADAAKPSDFDHVQVHAWTGEDIEPNVDSLAATLAQPGSVTLSALQSVPHTVGLLAVSTSGALSDLSELVTATPDEITATQLADGIVTETAISDEAITTPKLAANAVTAGKIAVGSITTDKLTVGDTTNRLPGADLDNLDSWGDEGPESDTDRNKHGDWSITIGSVHGKRNLTAVATDDHETHIYGRLFPVQPGELLSTSFGVHGNWMTGYARPWFYTYDQDGNQVGSTSGSFSGRAGTDAADGGYHTVTADYTIPDNVYFLQWRPYISSGNKGKTADFYDMSVRRKVGGVLIEDGAVTADKIQADALDGKTITGAKIRTAATGKRWELGSGDDAIHLWGYTKAAYEKFPGTLEIQELSDRAFLSLAGPSNNDSEERAQFNAIIWEDGHQSADITVGGDHGRITLFANGADLRLAGGYFRSDSIYYREYTSSTNVHVASSGHVGRYTSSRKAKIITDEGEWEDPTLASIKALNPRTYKDRGSVERRDQLLKDHEYPTVEQWRDANVDDHFEQVGLIAEDVADLDGMAPFVEFDDPNRHKEPTNRAAYSKQGKPVSIKYDRLVVALLPWEHEQDDRISKLEAENAELKQRLAKLEATA